MGYGDGRGNDPSLAEKKREVVTKGEPLLEVETAKITSEIEATVSGVVAHILAEQGHTVPCLTALAIIVSQTGGSPH